jgi:hypothetical protein
MYNLQDEALEREKYGAENRISKPVQEFGLLVLKLKRKININWT